MAVLFVDIVGFTDFSANRPPDAVVQILNEIFCRVRHPGRPLRRRKDQDHRRRLHGGRQGDAAPVAQLALDMLDAMRALPASAAATRSTSAPACMWAPRWPASSDSSAFSTMSGAMRSTPPVAWSRPVRPGGSRSPRHWPGAAAGISASAASAQVHDQGQGRHAHVISAGPPQRRLAATLTAKPAASGGAMRHGRLSAWLRPSAATTWADGSSGTPSGRPGCAGCAG